LHLGARSCIATVNLHFGGASGVAIIAPGDTDLYCHSEPPLTSGKLCFIINFIGGHRRGQNFYWGGPSGPPFKPPLSLAETLPQWPVTIC